VVFRKCVPRILSSGKKAGRTKKAFSLVFNLKTDRSAKGVSPFLRCAIMANVRVTMLKDITTEFIDNGVL